MMRARAQVTMQQVSGALEAQSSTGDDLTFEQFLEVLTSDNTYVTRLTLELYILSM